VRLLSNLRLVIILAAHLRGEGDGTRMGWMVTLVLVMATTMPPIVMEQADAAVVDKTAVARKLARDGVSPTEKVHKTYRKTTVSV
jgi:hypothetical protein